MSHELNAAQKEAVNHTDGALMIIAGAGTGKTRVITHRIAHLIETGVLPEHILAVTFTNKAAKEMQNRVVKLLEGTGSWEQMSGNRHTQFSDPRSRVPFIGTFHALGVKILRDNSGVVGIPKHFSILDRDDSIAIIKRVSKELGLDPKRFPAGTFLAVMSRHKGEAVDLDMFKAKFAVDYFSQTLALVWERYESECKKERALDFDDLLLQTLRLLEHHPEILAHYHERWTHLHVDEYQDTNTVQYELVRLLAQKHNNICVVGDHDQCIYTWRSADIRNLERFEKEFPNVRVVTLEENYRSTQTILKAANDVIKLNEFRKEKTLFTSGTEGEKIALYAAGHEGDEAHWIAETAGGLINDGTPPHHIAVLFRANFQSRALEEGFLKTGVPYQVLGVRFYERKEVKDVLSYIHAALNPDSATHLSRIVNVPARGIGKVTLLKILSGQTASLPAKMQEKIKLFRTSLEQIAETAVSRKPSETVKFVLRESGIEHMLSQGDDDDKERLLNTKELASLATRYDTLPPEEGIRAFLEDATLASDQDALKESEDSVKLMTVHAAKGLEFAYVFITGLEEGLFPSEQSEMREKPEEREEERRLFYVALTRAKEKLFLSYTMIRTLFGSPTVNVPSRFISDISPELIEDENPDVEWNGGRELLTID